MEELSTFLSPSTGAFSASFVQRVIRRSFDRTSTLRRRPGFSSGRGIWQGHLDQCAYTVRTELLRDCALNYRSFWTYVSLDLLLLLLNASPTLSTLIIAPACLFVPCIQIYPALSPRTSILINISVNHQATPCRTPHQSNTCITHALCIRRTSNPYMQIESPCGPSPPDRDHT